MKLLLALITVKFLAMSQDAKALEACGKSKVISGTKCTNMKVEFDLSGCEENVERAPATLTCKGSKVVAIAKTGDFWYRAVYEKDASGKFQQVGKVWKGEDKSHKAVAAVHEAEETVKPDMSILPLVKSESLPALDLPAISKPEETTKAPEPEVKKEVAKEPEVTSPKPEAPAAAPAVAAPGISAGNGVQILGTVDAYYSYNFGNPAVVNSPSNNSIGASRIPLPGNNNLRLYDIYHNNISLSLAEVTIKKTGSNSGFLIDLDFGDSAELNAASGILTSGPYVDNISKNVGQAYLTYNPIFAPRMTITAGKMATHIGWETFKAKENFNYSRSSVYSFGFPIWHLGASIGYAWVPEVVATTLYVYNGWNNLYDNNTSKTLGAQMKLNLGSRFSVTYNYIGGPEQAFNNNSLKQVHEMNIVITPIKSFSMAFEGAIGHEDDVTVGGVLQNADWSGESFAAKLNLGSSFYISPRVDYFNDRNGYILAGDVDTNLLSYTLTNAVTLADGLETRIEFRYDTATQPTRYTKGYTPAQDQTTATLAILYSL